MPSRLGQSQRPQVDESAFGTRVKAHNLPPYHPSESKWQVVIVQPADAGMNADHRSDERRKFAKVDVFQLGTPRNMSR